MTVPARTPGRDTYFCPRCSTRLDQAGEVAIHGVLYPTFCCENCIVSVDLFGENFYGTLTFCVAPDGRPFDPAAEDGSLPPAAV